MDIEKESVKMLLSFSDDKGKKKENVTEEYIQGVQDSIDRLEFLWLCEKYGAYDENDWLVMDTYRKGMISLKLLIED